MWFRLIAFVLFCGILSAYSKPLFSQSASTNVSSENRAKPLIVAHRGASADAPENTLPAFQLAWKQNADAIEGDFHLTKDGHIVCIHDKDTKEYCDQNLVVKNSTLKQLRQLDVGKKFNKKFSGTKIPTISEVFQTVPEEKKIFVEVKCGPEIIPELLKEIKKSPLKPSQIVLISFQANVIEEFKKHRPDITANWLSGFKKTDGGSLKPTSKTILETLKKIKADGFSSSKKGITLPVIQEVKNAGYGYHVWTVDSPKTAKKFLHWETDSITTNKPGYIRKTLFK